jgi:glycine/D-amino acid oxidase-like deaminating enzyme
VVLGGRRDSDPGDDLGLRGRLNPRIQQALEDFLPEAFPSFPPFRVEHRWVGLMDSTPDGRPLVGRLSSAPAWWVIAGFGGHGLPAALGAGKALSESIVSGVVSPILSGFDPWRFNKELS